MKFILLIFIASICLMSCQTNNSTVILNNKGQHVIAIQPLGKYDLSETHELKSALEKRLNVEVFQLNQMQLPASAYYKPRQRYIADSLLDFLKIQSNDRFEKVIGITTEDISTKKKSHSNWGVMGFAKCPGTACVISSYRVKPGSRSDKHYSDRMLMLALHELGHTYSLKHCGSKVCIMRDAEGKMNLDDADDYCKNCREILRAKKVLL
jgi:archaemetzincin